MKQPTDPPAEWCPWDEQWVYPADGHDHWCPAMDEHRKREGSR